MNADDPDVYAARTLLVVLRALFRAASSERVNVSFAFTGTSNAAVENMCDPVLRNSRFLYFNEEIERAAVPGMNALTSPAPMDTSSCLDVANDALFGATPKYIGSKRFVATNGENPPWL